MNRKKLIQNAPQIGKTGGRFHAAILLIIEPQPCIIRLDEVDQMNGIRAVFQSEQQLVEVQRRFQLIELAAGLRVKLDAPFLRRIRQLLHLPIASDQDGNRALSLGKRLLTPLLALLHERGRDLLLRTQNIDNRIEKRRPRRTRNRSKQILFGNPRLHTAKKAVILLTIGKILLLAHAAKDFMKPLQQPPVASIIARERI